ncbi:hypothetical protein V866_001204 [Kwoniella sp. B9012]
MSAIVTSSDDRPSKKRKQRQPLNCAECRRLKLKCDRQVPCLNCVRRSCAHLCPDKDRAEKSRDIPATAPLAARVNTLEGILRRYGIPVPTSILDESQLPVGNPYEFDSLPRSSTDQNEAYTQLPVDHMETSTSGHAPFELSPATAAGITERAAPASTAGSLQGDSAFEPETGTVPSNNTNTDEGPLPAISTSTSGALYTPSSHLTLSDNQNHGTLVLGHGGKSKYFGPTAASEWLKDQEEHGSSETPDQSRVSSPKHRSADIGPSTSTNLFIPRFPFQKTCSDYSTNSLLAKLPEQGDGRLLVASYYRYFAWNYNVITSKVFEPIFERSYQRHQDGQAAVTSQELGLVFIILAMGTLHNLERLPHDPLAEEYRSIAQTCLAKGNFMANSTMAGVQAIHIMAHYLLETDQGRNGDATWPLWGLAMRIIQAMGLHRDGERWNLSSDVVEMRRRLFWECHSADVLQAHCFSRPSSMSMKCIDTAFPTDADDTDLSRQGFSTLKFQLSQISLDILNQVLQILPTPYSTVTELHQRLCSFERQIPYHLRSRSALLALPSAYPNPEDAVRDSPMMVKSNVSLTFQQSTLAINISETILYLHRPYFAQALYQDTFDPIKTEYSPSYLAVTERCHVIIQVISTLYATHPNVCARHWFLWYHTFNCAVCMGTLILKHPQNSLVPFALAQIDMVIELYTSVLKGNSSKRMVENLQWLVRLKGRAIQKMNQALVHSATGPDTEWEGEKDDIELIGWRTRLVERVGKRDDRQIVRNVWTSQTQASNSDTPDSMTNMDHTVSTALQQLLDASFGVTNMNGVDGTPFTPYMRNLEQDTSTNDLLHDFWAPLLPTAHPLEENWWNT